MNALRNLSITDDNTAKSIQRLSTGLRINTGADDPAGMVISENLQAQILGIDQAVRNSQDAVNMAKTADAALSEVATLLRNCRAIAVHAANRGVVDDAQLRADQSQILNTVQSIDRIADTTSFAGKKLFDGTAGVQASVLKSSDVGALYIGSRFANQTVASGSVSAALVQSAARADVTLTQSYASLSSVVAQGTIVLNGYSISTDGTETLQAVLNKINALSAQSGVTAQAVTANGSSVVELVQNNYGSRFGVSLYDTSNLINTAVASSVVGTDAVAAVTLMTTQGATTVNFTGGRGSADSGLRLTDSSNNVLVLTEQGNVAMPGAGELVGALTAGSVQFQVGANAGETAFMSLNDIHASNLGTTAVPGKNFATIDLSTAQGANDAISIVDAAIEQLSTLRGDLGSFQTNVMESNVRSLNAAKENLSATLSSTRDADVALEMTQYTRNQILMQSGMAMLAQANKQPSQVLQLLQ